MLAFFQTQINCFSSNYEKMLHIEDPSTYQKYADNITDSLTLYHCLQLLHSTTALFPLHSTIAL